MLIVDGFKIFVVFVISVLSVHGIEDHPHLWQTPLSPIWSWQQQVSNCAHAWDLCSECNYFRVGDNATCFEHCARWMGWNQPKWHGKTLSPSSLFGRYMFCLAVFAPSNSNGSLFILDLLMHNGGGSPSLFRHGLSQRCKYFGHENNRLMTFEINAGHIKTGVELLNGNAYHLDDWDDQVEYWHSNFSSCEGCIMNNYMSSSRCEDFPPRVFIGYGNIFKAKASTMLKMFSNVDIVHLDFSCLGDHGYQNSAAEFLHLIESASPSIVCLSNINVILHAQTWIFNRLKSLEWKLLTRGHTADNSSTANNIFDLHSEIPASESVFKLNRWQVRGWAIFHHPSY